MHYLPRTAAGEGGAGLSLQDKLGGDKDGRAILGRGTYQDLLLPEDRESQTIYIKVCLFVCFVTRSSLCSLDWPGTCFVDC